MEDFHDIFLERPPPRIEDIRFEILWYCRTTKGELWPDEIAQRLRLNYFETAEAMEMLAEAGQLACLPYGKRWLPPRVSRAGGPRSLWRRTPSGLRLWSDF